MKKIDRAWLDEQISHTMEQGRYAETVYDLAALVTVRDALFCDGEGSVRHITNEEAEKWVRSMRDPDGKPLEPVSMTKVQAIAPTYGATTPEEVLELWVVVNMMRSDNLDVGQKYAGDAVEFYAALARDWLRDKDAVPDKLEKYRRHIVKQAR